MFLLVLVSVVFFFFSPSYDNRVLRVLKAL